MLHDKSRRRTAVRSDGDTNLKRNVILAVLFIVLLITAIEVRDCCAWMLRGCPHSCSVALWCCQQLFTRARPTNVANDPLLDPMMNPNIRSE